MSIRVSAIALVMLWLSTGASAAPATDSAGTPVAAWEAAPSAAIQQSELNFQSAGSSLRGTLFAPKTARKVPAIVVFHGASEPTRDLALYDHLKRMLPPLGIAVFLFDRRGSGQSSGPPANGDFTMLADDGIAAARMLASNPRIDASKIGYWGLSQGGWLALLAASRDPHTAFTIAISAPMTTPDVQMIFAVQNILRIKGYPQKDIDTAVSARKAVDDFERGKLDRATAQARLDAAAREPWFDLIYMGRTFKDPDQSGWAKEIKLDPVATLLKVRVPALILYGARDPWVPAGRSIEIVSAKARELPRMTSAVIAGANHEMELGTSDADEVDEKALAGHAPNSSEYFGRLASWLTSQGIASAASRR